MLNYFKKRLPKEKSKEELDEHYDKMDLEKSDFPAMLIAAFLIFAAINPELAPEPHTKSTFSLPMFLPPCFGTFSDVLSMKDSTHLMQTVLCTPPVQKRI